MMITQESFHVFEMWIGMNEFDHCILALLKQQRERPENFNPHFKHMEKFLYYH